VHWGGKVSPNVEIFEGRVVNDEAIEDVYVFNQKIKHFTMLKRFVLLLSLALVSQILPAQLQIVGANYNSGTGVTSILRWNADSGVVNDSIATVVPAIAAGASMFDAYNDRYYFADPSTFQEINFDSASCTPLLGIQQGVNAEISMATGKLFRLQSQAIYDSTGQLVTRLWHVVQSRFSTGQDSIMGTFYGCEAVYGDVSAFDSNLGIYYFFGIDSVLGNCLYSVQTNATSFTGNKVALSGTGLSFAGIEYDNEYNILYAINSIGQGNQRHWQIQQVNVSTGAMTLEADFPQLEYYQATTCTFDQTSSSMVFVMIDSTSTSSLYSYATVANVLNSKLVPSGLTMNELECDNTAFARAKYGTVSVADEVSASKVTLYPNPAMDVLKIDGMDAIEEVLAVDALGRSTRMAVSGNAIDVSVLAPGYYILRAMESDGQWSQSKFIKR
jgi:hypothetical protein